MDIVRNNSVEFELGVVSSMLLVEQEGDTVNGLIADDINRVVLDNLARPLIPQLNHAVVDLELERTDRPQVVETTMNLTLAGCSITMTVIVEIFAAMDESVIEGYITAIVMPAISSTVVETVGRSALYRASTDAGYEDQLRAKAMERNPLAGLLGGMPMPSMAAEPVPDVALDGGGMYL